MELTLYYYYIASEIIYINKSDLLGLAQIFGMVLQVVLHECANKEVGVVVISMFSEKRIGE